MISRFIVCPWYGLSAVRTVCVVLCTLTAERRHCFLCAAGSGNRKNGLRSKQELREITLRHYLWQNTAAFWALKGKWAGFSALLIWPWMWHQMWRVRYTVTAKCWPALYCDSLNYINRVVTICTTFFYIQEPCFPSRMLLHVPGSLGL